MIKKSKSVNTFQHFLMTIIPKDVDTDELNLLFNSYCLTSILNQSDNNFIWIIVNRNENFKFPLKKTKYLNILLIDEFGDMSDKQIKKLFIDKIEYMNLPNIQFIITTTIRYDECYSNEFVKTIHKYLTTENKYLYFYPILFKIDNQYFIKKYGDKQTLSLIERNDKNLETIINSLLDNNKITTRNMEKVKTDSPLILKTKIQCGETEKSNMRRLHNYLPPAHFSYKKITTLSK